MCSLPILVTAFASWKKRWTTSLLLGELAVDDLERDLLADQRVLGEIHGSHAARPDLLEDAVAADRLAGGDQVRCRL